MRGGLCSRLPRGEPQTGALKVVTSKLFCSMTVPQPFQYQGRQLAGKCPYFKKRWGERPREPSYALGLSGSRGRPPHQIRSLPAGAGAVDFAISAREHHAAGGAVLRFRRRSHLPPEGGFDRMSFSFHRFWIACAGSRNCIQTAARSLDKFVRGIGLGQKVEAVNQFHVGSDGIAAVAGGVNDLE